MQKEYLVVWKIEITADSPREAAQEALIIQRDAESEAVHFEVFDTHDEKQLSPIEIDLS